ncbi:MAG: hypothetical protein V1697_01510 [Candidatus Levyibacteriota bacterium]
MFKSKGLIIAAIAILAIIGSALYLNLGKKTSNIPAEEKTQTTGEMVKGTIKSLFGTNKNTICTINDTENQGSGKLYISNNKVRGDFTLKTEGEMMESHFIQDGEFTYIWSSEMEKGIKMKADLITEDSPEGDNSFQEQAVDLNKEVDYKCSNWAVDNSKFAPPSNIEFSDMTYLMMPKTTPPTDLNTIEGSPCDQMPDAETKAACEKALEG